MVERRVFVDSSVWLMYFIGAAAAAKEWVESEENILYSSVLSLHEVKRKLSKMGYPERDVEPSVRFIRENSVMVAVDEELALDSVKSSLDFGLHTVDAVIYTSSISNGCVLLTADRDFKGLKDVKLVG